VGERIWEVLCERSAQFQVLNHGFTYSGHPLGTAAALANVEVLEQDNLVPQAAERGQYLLGQLRARVGNHPLVGDVRGVGLMCGVELSAHRPSRTAFDPSLRVAARVFDAAAERGLLVRGLPTNDTVAFSPPFVVSEAEIDTMIGRFSLALDAVAVGLEQQHLWSP
jgi:L-2,4-diaminobutyrate transaminase